VNGRADDILIDVLGKGARFWRAWTGASFSQRRRDMINRLLDGLEGKLTSSQWAR